MSKTMEEAFGNAVPQGTRGAEQEALDTLVLEEQLEAVLQATLSEAERVALAGKWNSLREDGKSAFSEAMPFLVAKPEAAWLVFQARKDAQNAIVSAEKKRWTNLFCAYAATLGNPSASRNHENARSELLRLQQEFPASHRDALSRDCIRTYKDQRGLGISDAAVQALCKLYGVGESTLLKK
jgi:hypothetical protein